jgi:hypothetical protein
VASDNKSIIDDFLRIDERELMEKKTGIWRPQRRSNFVLDIHQYYLNEEPTMPVGCGGWQLKKKSDNANRIRRVASLGYRR